MCEEAHLSPCLNHCDAQRVWLKRVLLLFRGQEEVRLFHADLVLLTLLALLCSGDRGPGPGPGSGFWFLVFGPVL